MNTATPDPFVIRGDRAAMRLVGFRSPDKFSQWAIERGLKPATPKPVRQQRTVYSVQALRRAALAECQPEKTT